MNLILAFILLFTSAHSRSRFIGKADLKTGDVILVTLPCQICSVIEAEEKAPFSHMGLVARDQGEVFVLDAYDRVRRSPLHTFLDMTKKGSLPLVVRAKGANGSAFEFQSKEFLERFSSRYEGLSYDSEFLWDNRDERGEKYYCSEFVAKFLNTYLPVTIQPKPMHYQVERDLWIKYFKGTPPDGKPGISPADFSRSPLFQKVGTLDASTTN